MLALWEMHRGTLGRRLAPLGHISYSSYLLHFPLQLLFSGVTLALSVPRGFFYTPASLLLFFIVLLPLSLCSYHYFERPCQTLFRRWAFRKSIDCPKASNPAPHQTAASPPGSADANVGSVKRP